jgi:hypothetical protein
MLAETSSAGVGASVHARELGAVAAQPPVIVAELLLGQQGALRELRLLAERAGIDLADVEAVAVAELVGDPPYRSGCARLVGDPIADEVDPRPLNHRPCSWSPKKSSDNLDDGAR